MNKLPTLYKVAISLVVLVAIIIIGELYFSPRITLGELKSKIGKVVGAECYESRSSNGIKLLVNYTGSPEQDFKVLPSNIVCEEIIDKFKGNEIIITYHENAYFGLSVAGETIIKSEQALAKYNNNTSSMLFIAFIACISIFAVYFKGKHVTTQARGTPQSGAPS